MSWAKTAADGLTLVRIVCALVLLALAVCQGAQALQLASGVLLAAWISDVLDGPLARKSGQVGGCLGSHDLEIDVAVGAGALIYLCLSGYCPPLLGLLHLSGWAVVFWRHSGVPRPYGVLFQGPIYVLFGIAALRLVPTIGRWMAAYAVAVPILSAKDFWGNRVPSWWKSLQARVEQVKATLHGKGKPK